MIYDKCAMCGEIVEFRDLEEVNIKGNNMNICSKCKGGCI